MAWVTLPGLLGHKYNYNLQNVIPTSAPVTIRAGCKNDDRYINLLPLLKDQEYRKKLEALDGQVVTLADFIKGHGVLADDIEWTFRADGRFRHWEGGLIAVKPEEGYYKTGVYLDLDLTGWLLKQTDETLARVCAMMHNPQFHKELSEHLGRKIPKTIHVEVD